MPINIQDRAELGIDGNCGFALIGENLQEGEAEFVEIPAVDESLLPKTRTERFIGEAYHAATMANKLWAAREAHIRLRARLGCPELSGLYYFGISHPYGN